MCKFFKKEKNNRYKGIKGVDFEENLSLLDFAAFYAKIDKEYIYESSRKNIIFVFEKNDKTESSFVEKLDDVEKIIKKYYDSENKLDYEQQKTKILFKRIKVWNLDENYMDILNIFLKKEKSFYW
ncbi:hypothetical protein ACW95P_04220 [Candidatus Mycoplasma pogonae]